MNSRLATAACAIAAAASLSPAATVYSGLETQFTYAGYGDLNLPENQDRITDHVWIVRGVNRGIFNIAQEPSYQGMGSSGPSPVGTLWAFGTTDDYDTLTYTTWADLHDGYPLALLGTNVVVHLLDDDIYIDLMFTQWEGNGNGGAFSYMRSTVPAPGVLSPLALAGLVATRRRRR